MSIIADPRLGGTSASNAPADALCAGRHQASSGIPDEPTEDSSFGTEIHEALKTDDPSKLQPDQLSIYEGCIDIREKLIMEKFGMDAGSATRIREERFWWRSMDGKLIHSGQVDLLVHLGTEALIIDYKALPGDVEESAANEQLRDQAALAAGKLGLTEIDVAIVQPLVTYSPQLCRYDAMSIAKAQTEMVARVTASNDPYAKRVAGTLQCKFCKARFTCKEYAAFTALSAPASMSSLTIPVQEWTPEQRALFCERLPMAMKWLEECKSQIKAMLQASPESVPGWKLGKGDTRRSINNPNELHSRFLAMGGTTEQFLACVEIGKGKLEAQVRAATSLKGKGLKAKLDEIQAGITDDKETAPSLEQVR